MQVTHHYEYRIPRYTELVSRLTGMAQDITLASTASRSLYGLHQQVGHPPEHLEEITNEDVSQDLLAAGKSDDMTTAYNTTIGEYVERYALRLPEANLGGHELFTATYNEVAEKGAVIDFEYLHIYDPDGYEDIFAEELTRETELLWTSGTNLLTGEEVYTPAELVWFRSGALADRRSRFPCTTSGVAAGPSMEFAVLAGILELVERDSIVDLWMRQRTPPTIDRDSIAAHWPEVADFVDRVEQGYADMHLFDFEPEVDIPTFGGIAAHEDGKFPNFIHGSGTDIVLKDALEQAATEGTQGWPYILNLIMQYGSEGFNVVDPSDNFERNVLHYALPESAEETTFYYQGETTPIDEQYSLNKHDGLSEMTVEEKLALAVERLEEAGWTPILFDLTTRDALEAGIRVTRVRCPEAVPLTPQSLMPVNHPRFDGIDDLCTKPHPSP